MQMVAFGQLLNSIVSQLNLYKEHEMFICKSCEKPAKCRCAMPLPSHGQCENCHKVAVCHDCHTYNFSNLSEEEIKARVKETMKKLGIQPSSYI